jgi:hypothetical protein
MSNIPSGAVRQSYLTCTVSKKNWNCTHFEQDEFEFYGHKKCRNFLAGIAVSHDWCHYRDPELPAEYCREGFKVCQVNNLRCASCYLMKK